MKGFNNLKGFGFLEPPEISSYIFAHFSEINMDGFKRLEQGSVVSNELVDGPSRLHAKNIVVLEKGNSFIETKPTDERNSRVRTPQFRANMAPQSLGSLQSY